MNAPTTTVPIETAQQNEVPHQSSRQPSQVNSNAPTMTVSQATQQAHETVQ